MPGNASLHRARQAANDEFYTQYNDIQNEVNAYLEYDPDTFRDKTVLLPCDDPEWSNFTKFFRDNFRQLGLRKLISTSFAYRAKNLTSPYQATLFEAESPQYNKKITETNGKVFFRDRGSNTLQWYYLQGTGDFNSPEVKALRDEADIIVTNPPFSLFRDFVAWIFEANKKFLILSNQNTITYKEIFPQIMHNKLWVGNTPMTKDMHFFIPECYIKSLLEANRNTSVAIEDGKVLGRTPAVWFTNLDHGRRHERLRLLTMEENRKHSRHKEIRETGYQKFDNYDAINVPYTDAIPSDYDGVMGVPISFLDKYCPEQFEIIGATESEGKGFSNGLWYEESKVAQPVVNGNRIYKRLFIKHKQ